MSWQFSKQPGVICRFALCKQVLADRLGVNDLVGLIYEVYAQSIANMLAEKILNYGPILKITPYIIKWRVCDICGGLKVELGIIMFDSSRSIISAHYIYAYYHRNCFIQLCGPIHMFDALSEILY